MTKAAAVKICHVEIYIYTIYRRLWKKYRLWFQCFSCSWNDRHQHTWIDTARSIDITLRFDVSMLLLRFRLLLFLCSCRSKYISMKSNSYLLFAVVLGSIELFLRNKNALNIIHTALIHLSPETEKENMNVNVFVYILKIFNNNNHNNWYNIHAYNWRCRHPKCFFVYIYMYNFKFSMYSANA